MLRCWASAGGAAGPWARRRGQGCRPCVGLGLRHEAREAIVIDQPGRWSASGAPSAEWGRRKQRDGSIVPGVWAACPLLLLRAVVATAVAICIQCSAQPSAKAATPRAKAAGVAALLQLRHRIFCSPPSPKRRPPLPKAAGRVSKSPLG